ncbi:MULTISPECIES: hypothetical protein [unclassified Streptomyces]|uniref:hypothetical protein n=1 Tax=unclassified Streptomyces TaxID=2593676 RepID=UPI002E2FB248|nr:hypothetical protein [Streptomyces sp. NBC_01268]
MNLTTIARAIAAAVTLTGAAFGLAAQSAHATTPATPAADASAAAVTHHVADGPEPVEVGEDGKPDLTED